MQTSNPNFQRIKESINRQALPIEIAMIESVMVLEKAGTPLPIHPDWIEDLFEQAKINQITNAADLLVENFSLLIDYLNTTEMVDLLWSITSDHFVKKRNFEALCATQEYREQLRNPKDHGWINFIIRAEQNGRKDLALKAARTVLKKFPSAKYNAMLIYEIAKFGDLAEIPVLLKNMKSFESPSYDDEKRILNYLNDGSWILLGRGAFKQAEQLLDMHLDIHKAFHPLINKGHAYLLQGNQKSAMVFYQKAMEHSGSFFREFDNDRSSLAEVITDDGIWQLVRDQLEESE